MITLRFHRAVYDGKAVDEAAKAYGSFATLELAEEPEHWVIKLSAPTPERERMVAGELGNFALGTTIRNGGVRA